MARWDDTSTSPQLTESQIDLAILPVGATEQHGPHLPLRTDTQIAEAIAQGVADRLGAFLLPAVVYGNSDVHEGYRGTVSLRPETLQALVLDIGRQLQAQGFRRIVVLNTHGGNLILQVAVRELNRSAPPGYSVLLAHPGRVAAPALRQVIETFDDEIHAGEYETSLILHLTPAQVGDARPDWVTEFGGDIHNYALTRQITARGVWGVSSKASAQKGAQALEILIEATTRYVVETFDRLAAFERLQGEAQRP